MKKQNTAQNPVVRSESFNNVVIGAGAGGLVSSYISAAIKAKVALIEKNLMGGDCLNYGCVPSKAIIRTAKFISDVKRHKEFGIKSAQIEFDFADVMDRVHRVIKEIEPHDSVERYTNLGVDCIKGEAEIIDATTVKVGSRILKTRNIILSIGASPFVPPIPGLKECEPLTSENLWNLRSLPKRLIVLGGGPIGCEMTQAFQRLESQVTQVEMAPQILGREDDDVANLILDRFKSEGVNVLTGTKAVKVEKTGSTKELICETNDGKSTRIPFDEILVAVGRRANTDGVDWGKLGIELNKNGTIKVDDRMRANGSNIYACGDCVGPYQFTHTAAHQAWYCAVNSLLAPFWSYKVDYSVIPWVTFTDPEVAQVGVNEKAAAEQGLDFEVTKYGIDDLDRAIAESSAHGMVKVITKRGSDKILGATVVGHHAGELITEFVAAMKNGYGLNRILGTIHDYPTFSEANKYAAGNWKKAHAPAWAMPMLSKFHSWRR